MFHLPEWCVYIDLAPLGDPQIHGVWVHMECDVARGQEPELRLVMDGVQDTRNPWDGLGIFWLPLKGSIEASIRHAQEEAQAMAAQEHRQRQGLDEAHMKALARGFVAPMLNLVLGRMPCASVSECADTVRRVGVDM